MILLGSSTMRIGCPFKITVRLRDGRWCLTDADGTHNHPPSDSASDHKVLRQLELKRMKDQIDTYIRLGSSTQQILTYLRAHNPKSCLLARDIINARTKLNRESRRSSEQS